MSKADQLKQAVVERLPRNVQADTSDLKVSVTECDVTMAGTVPNEFARQAIRAAAGEVFTGREISDQMVVRFSATSTTPSGEDLRSAVHSLFGWIPGLEVSEPKVTLEDGTIVVEGRVESPADKEKYGEAIRNYFGVVDLENRLRVTSKEDFRRPQEQSPSSPDGLGEDS